MTSIPQPADKATVPVTVLMPVYNSERYVGDAVRSILSQTFGDFEFLIVNDGSTDGSRDILEGFRDPRLRLVHTENRGVAAALRLGVGLARGGFIARMDADDESVPDRLDVQMRHMEGNPDAAVLYGLAARLGGDKEGEILGQGYGDGLTRWLVAWGNVIMHPTAMIRTSVLRRHGLNYRLEANRAEDLDLWNQVAGCAGFLFVPRVFVRYRIHGESVMQGSAVDVQLEAYAGVIRENFRRHGIEIVEEMARDLAVISGGSKVNPISHSYGSLVGKLDRLQEELAERFERDLGIDRRETAGGRAGQLVRWSRYMLGTSRLYAARLLARSVRLSPSVAGSRLFWLVVAGLFLPAWLREGANLSSNMLRRISGAINLRVRALATGGGDGHARALLRSDIYPLLTPLPPDEQRGWKAYPLFRGRTRNKTALSCHVSVLTKGNCPHPPHTHGDEEILLVLAGEVDLVLPERGGGQRMRLTAGEVVYYPAFFPHTLEAVSEIPTNYLMLKWSSKASSPTHMLSFGRYEITAPRRKPGVRNGFHSNLLFEGPTQHLNKLHCHVTRLEAGGGYDSHVDAHDVAIVMLEGESETLGRRFRPNSVIFYAAGEPHGMHNPGNEDACYIVFEFHGGYRPFAWPKMHTLRRRGKRISNSDAVGFRQPAPSRDKTMS